MITAHPLRPTDEFSIPTIPLQGKYFVHSTEASRCCSHDWDLGLSDSYSGNGDNGVWSYAKVMKKSKEEMPQGESKGLIPVLVSA